MTEVDRGGAELDLNAVLMSCLAECGITAEAIAQNPALAGLQQPNRRGYRQTDWLAQLEAAVRLSGDPGLMLHLGQRIQLADIGVLGFALMSCDDLRDVIKIMMRYHPIANNLVEWQFLNRGDGNQLRAVLHGGQTIRRRMIMETIFSTVYSIGASLIQEVVRDGVLYLDYPAPDHVALYQDIFSIPVEFNAPHCELYLPEALLDRKVRTANPSGRVVFLQQCESLLQDMNRADDISIAVRRQLIRASGAFPDIAAVATELHMSERSLRRRLTVEKTTFRDILDDVRNMLARQYLTGTSITVAEIAWLLDYSEPSSFRRAFIRWNGLAPDAYRQAQGQNT